jgi:deazaflavin-dependent oxidoreductase (nitroreductase family)
VVDAETQAIIDDHLARYLSSGGSDGHFIDGLPTLLLTSIGRRSGLPRTTPLIYGQDGEDFLVVGSLGGSPTAPQWYLNIAANPAVEVQVATERFSALARTADDLEKPRLWRIVTAVYPEYDVYQRRTERQLPVVVLRRELPSPSTID